MSSILVLVKAHLDMNQSIKRGFRKSHLLDDMI